MSLRIMIVCAESMAEGYAPYAHVDGIAKGMTSLGHKVVVVGEDSGPYHDAGILGRLWRYYKVNRKVLSVAGDVDVILARGHFAHFPWVRSVVGRGIPVVHEMNGMMFDVATTHNWIRPAQALINWSYRTQFRISDAIACVTRDIADQLAKAMSNSVINVVSNGVDPSIFYPDATEDEHPYAVFASALAPWHGVNTLLDAVQRDEWPENLDLMIAGDGVQTAAVIDRAKTNPRIRYVGRLSREELAAKMRKASVGLCLVESLKDRGLTEVYPLKLFEMMASGIPVVATDVPGQSALILDSQAGRLVPAENPGAVAEAVREVFHDPKRREMGLSGCAKVRAEHDWRIRAIELERVLRNAMLKRSRANIQMA